MAVSYSKLWKMLIDKKMMKKDLQASANLTQYVMRKLSKDEAVTTDTLAKICCSLDCSPSFLPQLYTTVLAGNISYIFIIIAYFFEKVVKTKKEAAHKGRLLVFNIAVHRIQEFRNSQQSIVSALRYHRSCLQRCRQFRSRLSERYPYDRIDRLAVLTSHRESPNQRR